VNVERVPLEQAMAEITAVLCAIPGGVYGYQITACAQVLMRVCGSADFITRAALDEMLAGIRAALTPQALH